MISRVPLADSTRTRVKTSPNISGISWTTRGKSSQRIWNKRPEGIALKKPAITKKRSFFILELKRMSDVTDQYLERAKQKAETQYDLLRTAVSKNLATRMGSPTSHLHSGSSFTKRRKF